MAEGVSERERERGRALKSMRNCISQHHSPHSLSKNTPITTENNMNLHNIAQPETQTLALLQNFYFHVDIANERGVLETHLYAQQSSKFKV